MRAVRDVEVSIHIRILSRLACSRVSRSGAQILRRPIGCNSRVSPSTGSGQALHSAAEAAAPVGMTRLKATTDYAERADTTEPGGKCRSLDSLRSLGMTNQENETVAAVGMTSKKRPRS